MMNEWGVFGVIAAMVTFALAVGAPVIRLNRSINVLTVTVETLKDILEELKRDNRKAHQDLQNQIDEHGEKIAAHSEKLAVLEERTH